MAAPRLSASELKTLPVRSDARGLLHAAGHLGAFVLSGALVWNLRDSWWVVAALFLHGYILNFFFCALHETGHQTPFASRWLNYALGHFSAFLLLVPYEFFRVYHWDHHRFTSDPERDPELLAKRIPNNIWQYLWHIGGIPNWKRRITVILRHAFTGEAKQGFIAADKRALIVLQARIYLALYVGVALLSVVTGSTLALWLWVLPLVLGQPFLSNYLLCEHTGCAQSDDTYTNTRTTYTNAWVRFFAWNMPYHVEHHLYPAVPFFGLATLNKTIAPHIVVADYGYVAAVRSILRKARA